MPNPTTRTSHTPGKWGFMGTAEFGYAVVPGGPGVIADNIPKEADARLIAAAPALLEALKGLLPAFDNDSVRTIARVYADRIQEAEAAIRLAQGEETP